MKNDKEATLEPSKGYIVFDPQLCTGCRVCMAVCSFVKERGSVRPEASRIQVHVDPFGGTVENYMPQPCLQCEEPQCLSACPVEAVYVDVKTGARVIDEDRCIRCGKCVEACGSHFDPPRVIFDQDKQTYVKCDLCGGAPECVKWCPNGALRFVDRSEFVGKGKVYSLSFVEAFDKDFGPSIQPFEGVKCRYRGPWPRRV